MRVSFRDKDTAGLGVLDRRAATAAWLAPRGARIDLRGTARVNT